MNLLPFMLLTSAVLAADSQEKVNPLFRELRDPGVQVSPGARVPLPAPVMADGLNAQDQQAVLKAILRQDYELEDFERNSVVAPQILQIHDLQVPNSKVPVRGVDIYFVAYGDLKTIADKDFLDRLLNEGQKEGQGSQLPAEALARHQITLDPAQEKHAGFGHVDFTFLDRVQISATGYSYWSQTDDSLLAATRLDPRFTDDPTYPNQWRSVTRDEDGNTHLGSPHPYEGAAYYLKITRLAEPAGALFAEAHLVFSEPEGWFHGANLLDSKLPLVVQAKVRSARRELLKAKKAEGRKQ